MSAAQHPSPKTQCNAYAHLRKLAPPLPNRTCIVLAISPQPSMSSAKRVCYNRNGTQITDIAYQPCNSDVSRDSVCCGTNHQGAGQLLVANDVCDPNGLCQNFEAFDGTNQGVKNWWRQGCTDPTWQSESCLKNVCNFGKVSLSYGACRPVVEANKGGSGRLRTHRCRNAQTGVGVAATRAAVASRRVFSSWPRPSARARARHLQSRRARAQCQLRCRHRRQEVLLRPLQARHSPQIAAPLHRAPDSVPVQKRE
jgi:hypothetical protein